MRCGLSYLEIYLPVPLHFEPTYSEFAKETPYNSKQYIVLPVVISYDMISSLGEKYWGETDFKSR